MTSDSNNVIVALQEYLVEKINFYSGKSLKIIDFYSDNCFIFVVPTYIIFMQKACRYTFLSIPVFPCQISYV